MAGLLFLVTLGLYSDTVPLIDASAIHQYLNPHPLPCHSMKTTDVLSSVYTVIQSQKYVRMYAEIL